MTSDRVMGALGEAFGGLEGAVALAGEIRVVEGMRRVYSAEDSYVAFPEDAPFVEGETAEGPGLWVSKDQEVAVTVVGPPTAVPGWFEGPITDVHMTATVHAADYGRMYTDNKGACIKTVKPVTSYSGRHTREILGIAMGGLDEWPAPKLPEPPPDLRK